MLLGRAGDDSAYWKELLQYAENAVRFTGDDDATVAAYRTFCAAKDIDERYIYTAYGALDIAGRDPRSHALLLRALDSRDQGIVASAIAGLAAQHDLDALPAIEKVLQQHPDDARYVALMLRLFESEAADRIALKYVAEDDREMYFESRRDPPSP